MPPTRSSRAKKQDASVKKAGKPSKSQSATRAVFSNPLPTSVVENNDIRVLLVYGDGGDGQLGLGLDENDIAKPKQHTGIQQLVDSRKMRALGVEQVAAGGMHSLVLDSEGQVWSFGVNDEMALGRATRGLDTNSDERESTPGLVEGLKGFRVVAIAASDNLSMALDDRGELRTWGAFKYTDGATGFNREKRTMMKPTPLDAFAKSPVFRISCGDNHAVALTCNGKVYTWGDDEKFRLGRKVFQLRRSNGLCPKPLALKRIVTIGTGTYTTFAVDMSGIVYAWGLNNMRQTGVSDKRGGDEDYITTPTQIDALHPEQHQGAHVVQIAGGEHHTIFLFDNGEVWGCGRCDRPRIGLSKDHPALRRIALHHEDAIQAARISGPDEEIIADARIYTPVHVPFPAGSDGKEPKMKAIASGARYCLACDEDGNMYAWGEGTSNQLGLGSSQVEAETPTRVQSKALGAYKVLQIGAGGQHVLLTGVSR